MFKVRRALIYDTLPKYILDLLGMILGEQTHSKEKSNHSPCKSIQNPSMQLVILEHRQRMTEAEKAVWNK